MQTGHRRFIPSAGSAQSASSLLCSPRKVRERQSCKWRLCPTEGSCADLTPGQSLHLLAKSPLEKNIESSLPQPLQSGDWPVKEPDIFGRTVLCPLVHGESRFAAHFRPSWPRSRQFPRLRCQVLVGITRSRTLRNGSNRLMSPFDMVGHPVSSRATIRQTFDEVLARADYSLARARSCLHHPAGTYGARA
jgi:hypothetical protein